MPYNASLHLRRRLGHPVQHVERAGLLWLAAEIFADLAPHIRLADFRSLAQHRPACEMPSLRGFIDDDPFYECNNAGSIGNCWLPTNLCRRGAAIRLALLQFKELKVKEHAVARRASGSSEASTWGLL
jgi:hypothetical protein